MAKANGDIDYAEMFAHSRIGREVVALVKQSGLLVTPAAKAAKKAQPAKATVSPKPKAQPAKATPADPDDD